MSGHVTLEWRSLGLMKYAEALKIQETAHQQCQFDPSKNVIFSVQHTPVVTFGKHANRQFMLRSLEDYKQNGVDVFETERGGEITAHMPGQLVVYPILHLGALRLLPKTYVNTLEQSVIDLLAQFKVKAHRDNLHPGVWVGNEKVCAIGIRIKQRVTMHGLAFNVHNDLSLFDSMIPCGIHQRGVTSLAKLGVKASIQDIEHELVERIQGAIKSQ